MSTRGASLIEILISLTILSVGVLGLAGVSTSVTKMIASGRRSTVIASHAQQRLEKLRASINGAAGCGGLTGGSATLPGGFVEQWSVLPGIRSAALEVVVTSPGGVSDTTGTVVFCP